MPGYRPERLAEMIHRELSIRLRDVLKDPNLPPVSITRVEVTRDLRRADISWMPLGGGPVTPELEEAMEDAARQLRGPIGRALRVRYAPELVFEVDTHTEQAVRMTDLLRRIGEELREQDDGEPYDASGEEE